MARKTTKSLEEQRAGFVKRSGRQSKNIVDLRDKPPRPGMNPAPTKAYKKDNTLGKMAGDREERKMLQGYDRLIDKGNVGDADPDLKTLIGNAQMNGMRQGDPVMVGQILKNRKLDTKGKFAKFFKHTEKSNLK